MYSDQKANSFINKIRKNSEMECRHILSKIEDSKAQAMLDAEREATASCAELISKEEAHSKKEISSKIAGTEESLKRELLAKRSEIIDTVFEKARKKLIDFAHGDEYPQFLTKTATEINSHFPQGECIVYMRKNDSKHESLVTKIIKNATVEYTSDITIGGIRVSYPLQSMVFDCTLDAGLEAQIEEFSFTGELSVI